MPWKTWWSPLLIVCSLATADAAASMEPYLFADLATGSEAAAHSVAYFFPEPVGGRVLLAADDGHYGLEPWATDGTSRGTHLLADLCPGRCSLHPANITTARPDLAFFTTIEHVGASIEDMLWSTDGTFRGTHPLVRSAGPNGLAGWLWLPAADRLVFTNNRAGEGFELWTSDGTPGGTALLRKLGPARDDFDLPVLALFADQAFFAANDGVHGTELWATDGTAAGTRLVSDINPGPDDSLPLPLGVVGDRLLFRVLTADEGRAIWSTDGTSAGTRLIRDLHQNRQGRYLSAVSDGQRLFFFADADDGPGTVDR